MFIKYSLAAAVVLATASVVAAEEETVVGTELGTIFTVPIDVHNIPENRNSFAATNHYLRKRQASSDITLTSVYGDVLYSVPITLGTPPQKFNLAIDTGSFVTWVVSNSCIAGACANITNHFNPALSTSAQLSTVPFAAQYVSGDKVSGVYMTEQYGIGNLNFKGVAGLVNVNQASLPPTVDGIMGLWSTAPGDAPILKILSTSKALAKNQIGVWLQANDPTTRGSPRRNAAGGEITFGGANPARYKEPITYVNCVGDTPWMVAVGGMSVNGRAIATGGARATIDTGTSLMVVPETVADSIHAAIPGSFKTAEYGWFVPCEGNTPITITLGNFVTTIPYTSFAIQDNYATLNTGRIICLSSAMYPMGATVPIKDWLLGAVFLKNSYSIYDFDPSDPGGRIGFAQLAVGGNAGTGPVGTVQPGAGNNNNTGSGNGGNSGSGSNNGNSGVISSGAGQLSFVSRALAVAAAGAVASFVL
ncbi:MAG: aspartic peptidase domain-containing protein [Linnemannia elongata]|nr:MAG: aspartic peptidase domain-containing protein [Linnemannia elongata]